ncbi:MAG: pyridoxamine 5'-phosphate oxidase family protein [Eubacteriales bacterium]|nr:pyridoxamine 5'-phosphate oxidase family protein [Eubacteriales bacterium]
MRRKDREITDRKHMLEVLEGCDCCRIGLSDGDGVYIVPLNFGYEEQDGRLTLYFHGAQEGKKLELMAENPSVGFELDRKHELVEGAEACAYSYRYQSIIGKGRLESVDSFGEKVRGLTLILSHYSDRRDWTFPEAMVERTAVLRLTVTEWTCKEH